MNAVQGLRSMDGHAWLFEKIKQFKIMSHTRVKTTYSLQGSFAGTDKVELYCHHNHTCDTTTFYNSDGTVAEMIFSEWVSGDDLWDAMNRLMFPFQDKWGGTLKGGVEYYSIEPWNSK